MRFGCKVTQLRARRCFFGTPCLIDNAVNNELTRKIIEFNGTLNQLCGNEMTTTSTVLLHGRCFLSPLCSDATEQYGAQDSYDRPAVYPYHVQRPLETCGRTGLFSRGCSNRTHCDCGYTTRWILQHAVSMEMDPYHRPCSSFSFLSLEELGKKKDLMY